MSASLTRIKPALGRIVVELLSTDEVSEGGIILPYGGQVITTAGRVIAICDPYRAAPDDKDHDAPAGPMYGLGEIVVFGKYSGSEVQMGRKKCIVMNESDILCTLHEEEPDATATSNVIPITRGNST